MVKKTVGITIDELLLEKAKTKIPNMSKFVEYCLKNYLGEIQGLVPIWKQQELIDTIGKCQLELYLMNEKEHIEENKKKAKIDEINFAWRSLYTEYRDQRVINEQKLEKAIKILNVERQQLIDIVEVVYAYSYNSGIDITEWAEVYEEYGDINFE